MPSLDIIWSLSRFYRSMFCLKVSEIILVWTIYSSCTIDYIRLLRFTPSPTAYGLVLNCAYGKKYLLFSFLTSLILLSSDIIWCISLNPSVLTSLNWLKLVKVISKDSLMSSISLFMIWTSALSTFYSKTGSSLCILWYLLKIAWNSNITVWTMYFWSMPLKSFFRNYW